LTQNFRPGAALALLLLCIYGGVAVSVDFPQAAMGIQSDEATYYMMGHSLAKDRDLTYRRDDLARVWKEFDSGPSGLFLKQGRDILEWGMMRRPPFFWTRAQPDPDGSRLYYGKSFIYPLFAAPFVTVFGTNGFLVLHALLLAGVSWCAYLFLHARAPALPSAVLAGAFVMATVVPVYFVWITPELFNFALGCFAYFCWLYKEVATPEQMTRRMRWLAGRKSDVVAALILGIATFSKPTNALLMVPIGIYLLWRRRFAPAVLTSVVFLMIAGGLFLVNMAISGEWNYQGGYRRTFYFEFPFQTPEASFSSIDTHEMTRGEALTEVLFNKSVFWSNLGNNLKWYFVGRYSGLVGYFAPAVFAMIAFLVGARRRPLWQWLVFGSAVAQILLFVISLPYTWFGGGGSVGNRYFMGAYGIFLFLLPPIASVALSAIPWIVGMLFVAKLVLNPFVSSFRPGSYADAGPLRIFPIEISNINDLPLNTERATRVVWFGDNPGHPPGSKDPGFQIYFVDRNAFPEAGADAVEKVFWVKGESRADFLMKTVPVVQPDGSIRPAKRLTLTLSAGPVPVTVHANVGGRSEEVLVPAEDTRQITFGLDDPFVYMDKDDNKPRFVWSVSISASSGFVPALQDPRNKDSRFLGIRVKPLLVE
jgi:hypothetical protein